MKRLMQTSTSSSRGQMCLLGWTRSSRTFRIYSSKMEPLVTPAKGLRNGWEQTLRASGQSKCGHTAPLVWIPWTITFSRLKFRELPTRNCMDGWSPCAITKAWANLTPQHVRNCAAPSAVAWRLSFRLEGPMYSKFYYLQMLFSTFLSHMN